MILNRKPQKFQTSGTTTKECWGELCEKYKGDERLNTLKSNMSALQKSAPALDSIFDRYNSKGYTRPLSDIIKGSDLNTDNFNNRLAYDYLGLSDANGNMVIEPKSKMTTWTKNKNFMKSYQGNIIPFLFNDLKPNATPEERDEYYNNILTKYGNKERLGTNEKRKSVWGIPGETENFSW